MLMNIWSDVGDAQGRKMRVRLNRNRWNGRGRVHPGQLVDYL